MSLIYENMYELGIELDWIMSGGLDWIGLDKKEAGEGIEMRVVIQAEDDIISSSLRIPCH